MIVPLEIYLSWTAYISGWLRRAEAAEPIPGDDLIGSWDDRDSVGDRPW